MPKYSVRNPEQLVELLTDFYTHPLPTHRYRQRQWWK
jgi:hypothetical protein